MNLRQYLAEQRQPKVGGREVEHPNKVIDSAFDQWNRFENFLKFASKKEVRDRLKDFDAPDFAEYIDPETIEKIEKARKKPPKPKVHKEATEKEVRDQH